MSRSGFVNENGDRGRLHALCGLPQAGKSTFANKWVQGPFCLDDEGCFPNNVAVNYLRDEVTISRPRVVLAGDDFRYALTGHEYLPHAEAHVFSVLDTAALALLRRGFDVLIDETSTSKPTLLRYLRLDPQMKLIFVDTPPDECKRRAIANGRDYLVPVIDRLAARLENLRLGWDAGIREDLLSQIEHRMSEDVVKTSAA